MNMNTDNCLTRLAALFRERSADLSRLSVTAGFDGFVDEMISVVQEREGLFQWRPVPDITTFGNLILKAAGHSSLREIIVHRADPGGCAVNMGDGLIALGVPFDCFATLGRPRHAAFDSFAAQCRSCHSWGKSPGRTLAFEFNDGKLMFSAVTQLAEFNTDLLNETLADGSYLRSCTEAKVIALTDWTLYPHMTSCWKKLQQDVYSQLKQRPYFFLDLVDPSSRSKEDIFSMLQALQGFEPFGPTVLGLNCTEGNRVAEALQLSVVSQEIQAAKEQACAIRSKLGISQVVIHGVKFAASASAEGSWAVDGPFCAAPKKSTGAGDRFNAGYLAGLMLDFSAEQRLLLGCACSGFFVREARSATPNEMADFIDLWAQNKLQ